MATLKLDTSDPETRATAASWAPNTEYTIMTGEDPASGIVTTVDEVEEVEESPAPAAAAGPAAVRAAMGATATPA